MNRFLGLTLVLCLVAATNLPAKEPRRNDEHVKWMPQRDVKKLIQDEIARFEKDLKDKLGAKKLAIRPFVVDKSDPRSAATEAVTIELLLDQAIQGMQTWADQDNQAFLPTFSAFRRAPAAGGSDLLSAPVMGPNPASLSGNVTFKLEWETVQGRLVKEWDHNEVDEVYEVELNGALTLGVEWFSRGEQTATMISHSVTRPIVQGWRVSLVASEGKPQEILDAAAPANALPAP